MKAKAKLAILPGAMCPLKGPVIIIIIIIIIN